MLDCVIVNISVVLPYLACRNHATWDLLFWRPLCTISSWMIFFTQPRGKPEKPQNVRPVASSYDFITLAWDEGFDGGYDTFYTVQFKKLGENVPRYDDEILVS